MDANNVNTDGFSHASSSKRENTDAILTSENLDKSDELVNVINDLKMNDSRYELNKATSIDAQGNLMSNTYTVTHTSNYPDTVTHNINKIWDQKLLSGRTIGEVSVLPPPKNQRLY